MGRAPCCDKTKVKRGPWSPEEDNTLRNYVENHGIGGSWIALPQKAGLKRCGKSCRLRWLNYLRPNLKHGGFTQEEDTLILTLYHNIGSRWSVIASQLPGRTDNDVKNYWNTKLKKKLLAATATATSSASSNSNLISTITTAETGYSIFPVDVNSQTLLPGLIQPPESAYNLATFPSAPTTLSSPFSADSHANEIAAGSWSSINGSFEDDAFLVEFGSGLMPYGLMNSVDFHENFMHQISHRSFG